MPRWLKLSLIGVSALLLVLALSAGALLALLRSDDERLGQALEALLGYLLQREMVIGEVVEADLDWDAYLLARDVRLANPEWAGDLEFASARELLIRINLPSIWREGPVLIHEAELHDARLNLLAGEGHAPSWDFWPDEEPRAQDEPQEAIEFPVVIREGRVTNSEVLYRDQDQNVRVQLNGELGEKRRSDYLQLDLTGSINEIALSGYGEIGPRNSLISGRDVEVDVSVEWGGLLILGAGTIADLTTLSGPDLGLEISAPTSRPLLDMLGMPEVRDGPLWLEGQLTDGAPGWALEARGSLEEFDLQVSGRAEQPLQLDGLDFKFTLDGPSLAELGAMIEIAGMPDVHYNVAAEVIRRGPLLAVRNGRMTAGAASLDLDGELPSFPGIDGWRADVHARNFELALVAPLIGMQELPPVPYDIKGTLASDEQGVELVNIEILGEGSSLVLNGLVGDAPTYTGTNMHAEVSGPDMAAVGRSIGFLNLPPEPYKLGGQLALVEQGWRLSDARFESRDVQLRMNGVVDKLIGPTRVDGNLHLASPDLADTLAAYGFEVEQLKGFPIEGGGDISGSPRQLRVSGVEFRSRDNRIEAAGMLGDPLNLDGLQLDLTVAGNDLLELLQLRDEQTPTTLPFQLSGAVGKSDNGFTVSAVKGEVGSTQVELDGMLAATADFGGSRVDLKTSGPALGKVLGPWLPYEPPDLPFVLQADMEYLPPLLQVSTLRAVVGDNELQGHLQLEEQGERITGRGAVELKGKSSNSVAHLMGMEPVLPDSPYTLTSQLQASETSLRLHPLEFHVGRSDLGGEVRLDLRPDSLPALTANLHSQLLYLPFLLPDVDELAAEEAEREKRGEAFDAQEMLDPLTKEELAERWIPEQPLPFDWLDEVQLDISYGVDQIYLREDARSSGALSFTATDGRLRTREFHWDGDLSSGKADVEITRRGETTAFDLYFNSRRIPLVWVLTEEIDDSRSSQYRMEMTGQGNDLRELATSLNGAVAFKGGGGKMSNQGLDLILGDILGEVFTRVNPAAQADPYTHLECHAGALNVENGLVNIVPGFVARTDKLDILSSGTLNLHNERLDIVFNTRSRKGLGISASKAITPYMKLGGNLANPQMGLNVKGAAVSGGAAIATGGLSILAEGMWDRWVATARNPCDLLFDRISDDPGKQFRGLMGRP